MYVYGGYTSDKADYLKDIYAFDLPTRKWEVICKSGKGTEPKARSYFSMVELEGNILIFGGTDGVNTLNDMWIYDTKAHEWRNV
jgi:protein phosphatase